MKLTDSNSKGKCIFQTRGGVYFGLTPDELDEAEEAIAQAQNHLDSELPRFRVDSRKY
ncbi:MAG: hypothetical protein HRT61_21440 [Ekhidna sp.]|nr:hypothetical protein [Ekhidna sp.]